MKMRKFISAFLAFAMILSFGLIASAKTEDLHAKISLSVVEADGYYNLNLDLSMDDPGLDLVITGSGARAKYNGSAIALASFTINNVGNTDIFSDAPINQDGWTTNASGDDFKNDRFFRATGMTATSAGELANNFGKAPFTIATIVTNYEVGTISVDDLKAKFSDFGYTLIKVATVADAGKATTLDNLTNYAVGDDGITKHVDADYLLGTPENATPEPSVKTITKTEDAIVNNATALKDKETDVEIGGAAGFAFTIPAGVTLDDNMIWSLTTADGKLYSEKINAGLSTLGEGSSVKVAATFVTGTHKGADAANKEITAVNGIFKAGEDFYFTDAADAKNQAAAAE